MTTDPPIQLKDLVKSAVAGTATNDRDGFDKLAPVWRQAATSSQIDLKSLPIDRKSFLGEFDDIPRGQAAEALFKLFNDAAPRPDADQFIGFLGVLCLTLAALEASEDIRTQPAGSTAVLDAKCSLLIKNRQVRDFLTGLYFPADSTWWQHPIDTQTLEFCHHGTTSMIFTVLEESSTPHDKRPRYRYALKLVLPPFLRVADIANATQTYCADYQLKSPERLTGLVQVYDSGAGWILMEHVPGVTLDEFLRGTAPGDENSASDPSKVRASLEGASVVALLPDWLKTRLMEDVEFEKIHSGINVTRMSLVAYGLCRALQQSLVAAEEDGTKKHATHSDLSPSNVILRGNSIKDCVLVDFGPNYLFTRTAAVGDESKTQYIAPEIKNGELHSNSDVFSLAQILILAGGQQPSARGTVPNRFYDAFPSLAFLLEQYLDEAPQYRTTSLELEGKTGTGAPNYRALQTQLQFELDVAWKVQKSTSRTASTLKATVAELMFPFKGEPRRQISTLLYIDAWPRAETQEGLLGDKSMIQSYVDARRRDVNALRTWSVVSVIASAAAIFFSFWWLLRDVPFDRFPAPFNRFESIFNEPVFIYPYVDSLGTAGYVIPSVANWPARIAAFTYALLGAKLYQAVYARMHRFVSWDDTRRGLAIGAEIWMRSFPFIAAILVLWPTLINTADWPLAVITGQTLIFVGNLAIFRYVDGALAAGQELGAVPSPYDQVAGYDAVRSWVGGSGFYAGICWIVGLLIYFGVLRDVLLYASMVAALNLFLYVDRCGLGAPRVRVAIHRAMFAGARLRTRRESPHAKAPAI